MYFVYCMHYSDLMDTMDNHAKVFTKLTFVPSKATVVFLMNKLEYVHFVTIMPILPT